MKKVQIKGKLSLDKMTIAKLNDQELNNAVGGFLSIGKKCSLARCLPEEQTYGLWCQPG